MFEIALLQRLLRERTLARYISALHNGDLDAIADILLHSQQDAVLERMLLEAHEIYCNDDVFFITEPEEIDMAKQPGTQPSQPEETLGDNPLPAGTRRRRNGVLRLLAAILLICIVTGGVLFAQLYLKHTPSPVSIAAVAPPASPAGWCISQTPQLQEGQQRAKLYSISGVAANDIWSVGAGYSGPNQAFPTALAQHWNGQYWTELSTDALAVPLNRDSRLNDVVALAPNDVWAVGKMTTAPDQTLGPAFQALIVHWDGSHWSMIPELSELTNVNTVSELDSIAAISANDIWAIGRVDPPGQVEGGDIVGHKVSPYLGTPPLVEHWDGSRWSVAHNALWDSSVISLHSITLAADHTLWIAGDTYTGPPAYDTFSNPPAEVSPVAAPGTVQPFFLHNVGGSWSAIGSPHLAQGGMMRAIAARTANDVWAVGQTGGSDIWGPPAQQPGESNMWSITSDGKGSGILIEHWDGSQWTVSNAPIENNTTNMALQSIAAVSANDAWAVGSANGGSRMIIEHWNGQQWQLVPLPPKQWPAELAKVTTIAQHLWTVGDVFTPTSIQMTLIEQRCSK